LSRSQSKRNWKRQRRLKKSVNLQTHKEAEEKMTQDKIGSVMVVGAGIAGMQAALDLADSVWWKGLLP
jgi:heterodisulfide reductase subunit A-like polyferredoxin